MTGCNIMSSVEQYVLTKSIRIYARAAQVRPSTTK